MGEETNGICNSTKAHLELQLNQPTKYCPEEEDVEAAKHLSPYSQGDGKTEIEENPEIEEKTEIEKKAEEEKAKIAAAQAKVPLIYQVEPGCTQTSCYASIITFIIMFIGVLALLLISPPFSQGNKNGPTFEELMSSTLNGQVFYKDGKVQDTIDVIIQTTVPPKSTMASGSLILAE